MTATATQSSRVHFTLRAYLVDEKTRRVLAWREFVAEAVANSNDPYAGVVASQPCGSDLLQAVSQFLVLRPD